MNEQISNHIFYQKASTKKGNLNQLGRDYINNTSVNFLISFFIIGVLALGGLAWALNVGLNPRSEHKQSLPRSVREINP